MSEHSPLSWFPFDVAEWTSSPAISMMLPEQEGAYLRLLLAAWGKGDAEPSLPTDAMQLAQTSKLGARWKKLSPLILAQFEERNGRLVSARQVTMWWSQQQKHAAAVTKATTAAKARHAKKAAPSMPQADLELPPGTLEGRLLSRENLDSTAFPSTPYGVEREKHVPADDAGPAPAGAAPADVAAEQERERNLAYRSLLEASAFDWREAHPADTDAIERAARQRLSYPLRGELGMMATQIHHNAVVEEIRHREGWPTLEQWDGADTFTPSEVHAPC